MIISILKMLIKLKHKLAYYLNLKIFLFDIKIRMIIPNNFLFYLSIFYLMRQPYCFLILML